MFPFFYLTHKITFCYFLEEIHKHNFGVKKILPLLQKQVFITCKEEQCQKQFTSAYNYQLHVKHHQKQFAFVCQICGKGFMNKNHYQSYSSTHLKEKPFPCTICKKRFLTKSNLCRHSATCNLITKKYECVYCGKKFITDANLKRHNNQVDSSKSK